MITITEKAIEKLKEISEAEGIGHLKVRLRTIGGGCAGLMYDFCFEEIKSDDDVEEQVCGISVLIDPISALYVDGVNIDYMESLFTSGFVFTNSNKTTCACGNSISY